MAKIDRSLRNRFFIERLIRRRPQDADYYRALIAVPEDTGVAAVTSDAVDIQLESIVSRERPVFFVDGGKIDFDDAMIEGREAVELRESLRNNVSVIESAMPLIGRIDVVNFPNNAPFLGTGWFVADDIVVTNRHVAALVARWDGRRYAFNPGIGGTTITASVCVAHDAEYDAARSFDVVEVLYIEPETSQTDIAFVRVARAVDGITRRFINVAATDAAADQEVCVVGYPARAPLRVIPDQRLMLDLYRGRFDIKRVAPGFIMLAAAGLTRHDCTTLGGNSGSVVLDPRTGDALGLHFAGLYQETNFAVRANVLRDYIVRRRWAEPRASGVAAAGTRREIATLATTTGAPTPSGAMLSIPLTLTVNVGVGLGATSAAIVALPTTPMPVADVAEIENAAVIYYNARPEGVLAARVGFEEDAAFIAVSVLPSRLDAVATGGPAIYLGCPVRYLPADAIEQLDALALPEAVTSVAYDADARTGAAFAFDTVTTSDFTMTLHVGPEFSWDVLKEFIANAPERLESAMYEFHADHVRAALEDRLEAGLAFQLVLDNASYSRQPPGAGEFDRDAVFADWLTRFDGRFTTVIAPEGGAGLIANSYHAKVSVRDDDVFWLSSGNWKASSSQPIITAAQRAAAAMADLPGNREWHVVIANPRLATFFRSHIAQDFARSRDLGGTALPANRETPEVWVELLPDIEPIEERPAPGRVLEPLTLGGPVTVRPLLTPDDDGAVYCDAMLALIRSARHQLLFQIPYIGMPPQPRSRRGLIDELIAALTDKLLTLPDARVLLRNQGNGLSSPTHAAWFFRSKGVDLARVRQLQNHHTKGMIVDGKRILIGSHNWSQTGVTLNRDASLLFDDQRVAAYFAEAFEIDWARSSAVRARRFVRPEAVGEAERPVIRVPVDQLTFD